MGVEDWCGDGAIGNPHMIKGGRRRGRAGEGGEPDFSLTAIFCSFRTADRYGDSG